MPVVSLTARHTPSGDVDFFRGQRHGHGRLVEVAEDRLGEIGIGRRAMSASRRAYSKTVHRPN
ncbi:hypothetical protein AB6802_07905 [Mesorhizobium sp. RCC_202]|uniref:hypothetical protein n=1 Tax=Mesorhizobium sp. RCC_202 TaxID=3239222 RepID=UPI003525F402